MLDIAGKMLQAYTPIGGLFLRRHVVRLACARTVMAGRAPARSVRGGCSHGRRPC